jgi:hypothetical protein
LVSDLDDGEEAIAVKVTNDSNKDAIHLYATPHKTGRGRKPSPETFGKQVLAEKVNQVKLEGVAAVELVMADLLRRFPSKDELAALAIVQPESWSKYVVMLQNGHEAAVVQDIQERVAKLKEMYCVKKTMPDGTLVGPFLDGDKLDAQLNLFVKAMADKTPPALDLAAQMAKSGLPFNATEHVWTCLNSSTAYVDDISEYFTLAELVMTIPIGSVENERDFSKMNLIKTDLRNRLGEKHLNTCMRIASSEYSFNTFPYPACFKLWMSKSVRYGLGGAAKDVDGATVRVSQQRPSRSGMSTGGASHGCNGASTSGAGASAGNPIECD